MESEDCLNSDLNCRRKLEFEGNQSLTNVDIHTVPTEDYPNHGETHDLNLINQIHLSLLKEKIPKIGLEFKHENDAYEFYKAYAKEVGFGIRKSRGHKEHGIQVDRTICCTCEGERGNDKRDIDVKAPRPITRCGCLAMMKISCRNNFGIYKVIQFIAVHNHVLSSPIKVVLHPCHRKLTTAQTTQIDMATSSGITPKSGFEFMVRQVGGRDNLGFISLDYKNYLCSKRTERMQLGDTGGIMEYLQRMQTDDPNFFYAIQVDCDDMITNIFWSDAKMMVDFVNFGDVVCFDTTYRKNKDGRPFAMFVGVNHHKQTVVFGAALLYDETAETFMWLFDTFARSMIGKKPITILTDQDAAMAKALNESWPETFHRLCIWHIYQNAASHLSHVFASFNDFAKELSSCIYDYEDEDDFIDAWNLMLSRYTLQNNEWLKRMFNIKKKWALVYGRETFCADMISTQRSESMNSLLKRYVSYKNDLLEFFHHFDRLVEGRRYQELLADFRSTHSTPAFPFKVEILRHAAKVYTHKVFESFSDQVSNAYDCAIKMHWEENNVTEYWVTPLRKNYHHTVKYDSSSDGTISCSCKKFEFAGLLCCHALKVFSLRNIVNIPEKYILSRWTKKAKVVPIENHTSSTLKAIVDVAPNALMRIRYRELCRLCIQVATRAAESEDSYELAKSGIIKMIEDVNQIFRNVPIKKIINETSSPCEETEFTNSKEHGVEVEDGNIIKVKGVKIKESARIKSSKRPKGGLERAIKKARSKGKSVEKTQEVVEQRVEALGGHFETIKSIRGERMHNGSSSIPNKSIPKYPIPFQYDMEKNSSTIPSPRSYEPQTTPIDIPIPSESRLEGATKDKHGSKS